MCAGSRNTVHHFHVSADELIRNPKAASLYVILFFGLFCQKKENRFFLLLLNNPAASLLKVSRFEVFSK